MMKNNESPILLWAGYDPSYLALKRGLVEKLGVWVETYPDAAGIVQAIMSKQYGLILVDQFTQKGARDLPFEIPDGIGEVTKRIISEARESEHNRNTFIVVTYENSDYRSMRSKSPWSYSEQKRVRAVNMNNYFRHTRPMATKFVRDMKAYLDEKR
jgi:hypothetical protein